MSFESEDDSYTDSDLPGDKEPLLPRNPRPSPSRAGGPVNTANGSARSEIPLANMAAGTGRPRTGNFKLSKLSR